MENVTSNVSSKMNNIKTDFIPPIFIAHGGGPMPILGDKDHDELVKNMKKIPKLIGKKPKAILVVSAHWEQSKVTLLETPKPDLLYDYYGFPEESYSLKYPAPLAEDVNTRIKSLFKEANLQLSIERNRGFDHGVFIPLLLMYPQADLPVAQISLSSTLDPEFHVKIGQILAPLTNEGVLILCSGLSFHNMKGFFNPSEEIFKADEEFHQYLIDALTNKDYDNEKRIEKLVNWKKAPNKSGKICHPREEHLIPLHVALGAANGREATLQKFTLMKYKTINAIFNLNAPVKTDL